MMGSFKLQCYCFSFLVALSLLRVKDVSGTTFTFVNKCDYIVWPGILSGASSAPLESTGFELPQGGTQTFQAPAGWSGRFWGRTGCNFDGSGLGSCTTGDCGSGRVECAGSGAEPPATLAEFTLNGSGGQDFYDVSLVDGYNVPMIVEASGGLSGGCGSTGCLVDLNQRCPPELQAAGGGACRSACEALEKPEYCCTGAYASPDTCKPTPYSELFKSACPKAYSYAYDDASSTFTCSGADYTITFCQSSPSQKSSIDSPGNTSSSTTAVGSGSGSRSGLEAGAGAGTGTGARSESESSSGSGSKGAMLAADGSWLANMAAGNSSNERHPSFGLMMLLVIISLLKL